MPAAAIGTTEHYGLVAGILAPWPGRQRLDSVRCGSVQFTSLHTHIVLCIIAVLVLESASLCYGAQQYGACSYRAAERYEMLLHNVRNVRTRR